MELLNSKYWEKRYVQNETGWDIGYASTPLVEYFNALKNKSLRILIPGAGNGYEAQYLHKNGFKNVVVIDWAQAPLDNLLDRVPDFPKENLICDDFFKLEHRFDLIIEQTFFCALHPSLREKYVTKMHELLAKNGQLAGLLFNFPLTEQGPPFGGNVEMYRKLFQEKFEIELLEEATNSIPPRAGKELFFSFRKK